MAARNVAGMAQVLRKLLKRRHSAELTEQLRLWAEEFNRRAKPRAGRRRRSRLAGRPLP
jgi:hypothetical protein